MSTVTAERDSSTTTVDGIAPAHRIRRTAAEPMAVQDWRLQDVCVARREIPIVTDAMAKAEAYAWSRHAAGANGFGGT
ncbi:MAG: hypothetical protein ACE5NW_03685 [Acidiferrobacterales bacterium]